MVQGLAEQVETNADTVAQDKQTVTGMLLSQHPAGGLRCGVISTGSQVIRDSRSTGTDGR